MVVDKELAFKVFQMLADGKSPYAIGGEGEAERVTSRKTAQRIKAVMEGAKRNRPIDQIANVTGWSRKKVGQLVDWYKEFQSGRNPPTSSVHDQRANNLGQRFLGLRLPADVRRMTDLFDE